VAVLDITQISAQTISTIVFALLGILSLNVALLTPLIGASTSIAVALWLVRHHIDLTIRPTRELITRLVSFGIRFATTSLAMIAHTSAAVLLMKFLIPGQLEQIGWYGRAASLAMMVGMISMGINPLLYASWADADATERRARQSEFATRLYMPLGILAACGVAALAPRILWLLYDDEFVPAAPFLRILAFSAALQLTANTLLNLFQAIGRPGIATMIMAVTLTANVSMSWFLIPRWGAYGSSCAMFASAVLWLTMTTLLARKYCGMRISNCFLPRWSDVVHVRNALLRRRPVPAAVSATPASDAPPPA
jgi:PST family polysaccharide transporter